MIISNMNNSEKMIKLLKKEHPNAKIALKFSNKTQLLVAVILSAQCTDIRVNLVTKELFKKYKTAKDFANANLKTFEKEIFSTGFYKNKAKNIITTCKIIDKEYNGRVPKEMDKLLSLPGVARKTANVVQQNGFGVCEGIVVDTHVKRLSNRLGLTNEKNPEKIEKELMQKLPKKYWSNISDLFIFHGRRVCDARKPNCKICVLNKLCPSAFSFNTK